jgi:hypothetical protein
MRRVHSAIMEIIGILCSLYWLSWRRSWKHNLSVALTCLTRWLSWKSKNSLVCVDTSNINEHITWRAHLQTLQYYHNGKLRTWYKNRDLENYEPRISKLHSFSLFVHFVARVLECSISTFGRKWDNAIFWFSVLCCTISTHFHRFPFLASVRFHNVFYSPSHLNCNRFLNFKPSFSKIGVEHNIF